MKTTLAQAALTEGVTPDGHTNVVKTVTAVPVQLGDYSIISDVLDVETLLPIIAAQGRELANNAGRLIDEFIQDTLANSSIGVMYAGNATARADLTAADTMDLDLILKACTYLSTQGQTGERFKIIMHPNVFLDYAKSSSTNTWLNKLIYEDFKGVKDGFVTAGVNYDIYVSANVKPFEVAGDTPFQVWPTYAFRDGAYGVGTLQNLQTFYKPFGAAGTEDPLNQRATVGWKCMYGCAVLNDLFIVRVESRAGTDYAWQESLSD
jgi:N4-gp56 family major capsid protein